MSNCEISKIESEADSKIYTDEELKLMGINDLETIFKIKNSKYEDLRKIYIGIKSNQILELQSHIKKLST